MEGFLKTEPTNHMINNFESLVEEMLLETPNEEQIKILMERLDLEYDADPIGRVTMVLEKMNNFVTETKQKRLNHDL